MRKDYLVGSAALWAVILPVWGIWSLVAGCSRDDQAKAQIKPPPSTAPVARRAKQAPVPRKDKENQSPVVVDPPKPKTKPEPITEQIAKVEPEEPAPIPVEFDIQGLKIGDRVTEEFVREHCPGANLKEPEPTCLEKFSIGGNNVALRYEIEDSRLIGVAMIFDSEGFEDMLEAYTEKFGVAPHKIREEEFATRGGLSYTNVIARWDTTVGRFVMRKYALTSTEGYAHLKTEASLRAIRRKKEAKTKALKGKL